MLYSSRGDQRVLRRLEQLFLNLHNFLVADRVEIVDADVIEYLPLLGQGEPTRSLAFAQEFRSAKLPLVGRGDLLSHHAPQELAWCIFNADLILDIKEDGVRPQSRLDRFAERTLHLGLGLHQRRIVRTGQILQHLQGNLLLVGGDLLGFLEHPHRQWYRRNRWRRQVDFARTGTQLSLRRSGRFRSTRRQEGRQGGIVRQLDTRDARHRTGADQSCAARAGRLEIAHSPQGSL